MYERRFGFKFNPFRAAAAGPRVFVGPHQAEVISSVQKALAGPDNIVVVSGAAGVGKSTLVSRALETNKMLQVVAWVGRMRLTPDEVLQLLLNGFGVSRIPDGTVKRFALFKHVVKEYAKADKRVIVVIEDALRVGNEALLEIESLTASDGDAAGGANIVLMGPPDMDKRLKRPELERLRQRARKTLVTGPMNAAEVQGYLIHCMRVAGVRYEDLFESGVALMLSRCSEGIPRVINSVCDAAFVAAEQNGDNRITQKLLREVAANDYGLDLQIEIAPPLEKSQGAIATNVPAEKAMRQPENEAVIEPAIISGPPPKTLDEKEAPPKKMPAIQPVANETYADTDADIPAEFRPDDEIEIIAGTLAKENTEKASDPEAAKLIAAESTGTIDDLPTLSTSMRVEIPKAPATATASPEKGSEESIFDTIVEPTIRQQVPDLDALEAAIQAARVVEPDFKEVNEKSPNTSTREDDLEITNVELPRLNSNIADAELEPQPETTPELLSTPLPEPEPAQKPELDLIPTTVEPEITLDQTLEEQRIEGQKLTEMAAELASANSLEDISDKMAETLFGTEFEQIAAEALATPEAAGTLPGETDVIVTQAVSSTSPSTRPANDPISESPPFAPESAAPKPQPVEAPAVAAPEPASAAEPPTPTPESTTAEPAAKPESIEDQFQTSITQTLKALDMARMAEEKINPSEAGESDKPAGLFGRFRNTLKS